MGSMSRDEGSEGTIGGEGNIGRKGNTGGKGNAGGKDNISGVVQVGLQGSMLTGIGGKMLAHFEELIVLCLICTSCLMHLQKQ